MPIKTATPDHAYQIAQLINLASHNILEIFWQMQASKEQTPLEVAAKLVQSENDEISYKNTRLYLDETLSSNESPILGMVQAYKLPTPYDVSKLYNHPPLIRQLMRLEAKVPGTWYINALATVPAHQRSGVATSLLADTHQKAQEHNCKQISLIVASQNSPAVKLYEKTGFEPRANAPIIAAPNSNLKGDWVLMVKEI